MIWYPLTYVLISRRTRTTRRRQMSEFVWCRPEGAALLTETKVANACHDAYTLSKISFEGLRPRESFRRAKLAQYARCLGTFAFLTVIGWTA